jgi:hypothetical protein
MAAGAAQRSDPEPAGPDLAGGWDDLLADGRDLLRKLRKGPVSERLILGLERLTLELMDRNDRIAALRIAYEDDVAAMSCRDALVELGRELGRAAQPSPPASPRPHRPGQPPLMRVVRGA